MVNEPIKPDRWTLSPRTVIVICLGLFISAAGVGLIVRVVDLAQVGQAINTLTWSWLGLALLIVVGSYGARGQRWNILLRPQSFRWPAVLRALLSGQLLNLLLPIRVGDVARALLLGREAGGSVARALGSIVIEKAWDWLALCLLILIIAWAIPLPEWFLTPARSIGLIAVGVVIGFSTVAVLPAAWLPRGLAQLDRALGHLPARWHDRLLTMSRRLLDSLSVLRQRSTVTGSALWTFIVWGLSVLLNYAVLRAYAVDSWLTAMTLLAVLMLGLALPPSIAGVGVFEGLTMLTLHAFGISYGVGLAIGLTLHLIISVPLLIGVGWTWLVPTSRVL